MGEQMTKEAMISPLEPRQYQTGWVEVPPVPPATDPTWEATYAEGWRVAQVVPMGETFPMAEPIFWTKCEDTVEQDLYVYNPEDKTMYLADLPLPSGTTS